MADQVQSVGPTVGNTTPAAAPASQPAPSSTGGGGRDSVIKSNAQFIRDGFKSINPSVLPDPDSATEPASVLNQTDSQADPAQARQPANTVGGEATPPSSDGSTPSSTQQSGALATAPNGIEALPGDEIIKSIEALAGEFAPKPTQGSKEQTQPDVTVPQTDEEIEKAINPDGKATQDQKDKSLRSYVGKQGRQIGEMRQALTSIAQLGLSQNKDGKLQVDLDRITNSVGPDYVRSYLADRGLKIVPSAVKLEAGPDPVMADLSEMVNQMIPGDELTADEKLAEIKADPASNARLSAALSDRQIKRHQQNETQKQQQRQKIETEAKSFADGLKALPH